MGIALWGAWLDFPFFDLKGCDVGLVNRGSGPLGCRKGVYGLVCEFLGLETVENG